MEEKTEDKLGVIYAEAEGVLEKLDVEFLEYKVNEVMDFGSIP